MTSKNKMRAFLMVTISAMTLTACGSSSGTNYSQKSEAPMPPITEMDAAMSQPAPAPVTVGVSDTLTPVAATPATAQQMATAVSAEDRIAKLEATVQALQADYQRIMPAFASLNTTNDRIQTLLDELESQGKIPPATNMAEAAPTISEDKAPMKVAATEKDQSMVEPVLNAAAPQAPQTVAATTQAQPSAIAPAASAPAVKLDTSVTAVRIGEHANKTRVVFDLSSATKPTFTYDLDNGEKLLLVDMPSAAWAGKDQGKPNSPLIAGWNAQKTPNGGAAVAIQLKKDARVLSTEFLKAEGKDPARLVMDIASGS